MADAAVLLHVSAIEDALHSPDGAPLDLEDVANRLAALAAAVAEHSANLSQSTLLKADEIFEHFALFAAAALKVEDAIEQANASTVNELTNILTQNRNNEEEDGLSDGEPEPEVNWDVLRDWFLANIAFPFPELVPSSSLPEPLIVDLEEFEHWVAQVRARTGWNAVFAQFAECDKRRMQSLCTRVFSSKNKSAENKLKPLRKDIRLAFIQVRDAVATVCSEIDFERQQPAPWMDHLEEMIKTLGLSDPSMFVDPLDDAESKDSTFVSSQTLGIADPSYGDSSVRDELEKFIKAEHSDANSESGTDYLETSHASPSSTSSPEVLPDTFPNPLLMSRSSPPIIAGAKRKFDELDESTSEPSPYIKISLVSASPIASHRSPTSIVIDHSNTTSAESRPVKKMRLSSPVKLEQEEVTLSALSTRRSLGPQAAKSPSALSPSSPNAPSPSYSSSGSESGSPSHSLPTPPDYNNSPSPPAIHHSDTPSTASFNTAYSSLPSKPSNTQSIDHSNLSHSPRSSTHSKAPILEVSDDISGCTDHTSPLIKPNQPQITSPEVKRDQVEEDLKIIPSRLLQEQICIQRKRKRKPEVVDYPTVSVVSIPSPESNLYDKGSRPMRPRFQRRKYPGNAKEASAIHARPPRSSPAHHEAVVLRKIEPDPDNFRPLKRIKGMGLIPNG